MQKDVANLCLEQKCNILSGIELPWTLRVGLYLFMRRLSCIINSHESEQEERILKSSKSTL